MSSRPPSQLRNIASPDKIALHPERLAAFLRGEDIYPVCLELDITTACSNRCENCPSQLRPTTERMSTATVERLFAAFDGQTTGLLLSGGEPTMAANFPAVLTLARHYGFADVTLVTNGSRLDDPRVVEALLGNTSAVRISLYGWEDDGPGAELQATLARVAALRNQIEAARSPLEIGFSVLTAADMTTRIRPIVQTLADNGVHWIYFHPRCEGWERGCLDQYRQDGVLAAIREARALTACEVLVCDDRYQVSDIAFDEYYTAHFLMVVGADGRNYLGTEVKYQPDYAIADLSGPLSSGFLWTADRRRRIREANHQALPSVAGRHRGILYADLIQRLKDGRESLATVSARAAAQQLRFPSVL